MKKYIIIIIACILVIGIIAGFCIYNNTPKQLGANNPNICEDDFIGPLSQSQEIYCEELIDGK